MNIWQSWRTLRWVLEMKFADGNWYCCGAYGTSIAAHNASRCMLHRGAVRIDGPAYTLEQQAARA